MFFLNERMNKYQIIGSLIACLGIGVVIISLNDTHTSFIGALLVLAAAAAWGMGNIIAKNIGNINKVALVIWGSFVAWVLIFFSKYFVYRYAQYSR